MAVVTLCFLGGLARLLAQGDPWWQAASSTGTGVAIPLGARALVVAFRRGWQEG